MAVLPAWWVEIQLWCKRERPNDDEQMRRFVPIEDLFKGRHFDRQIIVLCVSWYLREKLLC
jgi:hypothetical protein